MAINALISFEERLIAEMPALRRYGRVLCRDQDAAEDLLQESVERALRRRHLERRPGNFRAWLFRIMHNLHANDVRWRARRLISKTVLRLFVHEISDNPGDSCGAD